MWGIKDQFCANNLNPLKTLQEWHRGERLDILINIFETCK